MTLKNHLDFKDRYQKVKIPAWLIRKDLMMIIVKYIKSGRKNHKFMTSTTLKTKRKKERVQCRKRNVTKNTKVINEWDMFEISHVYPHGPIFVISSNQINTGV